MDQDYSDIIKKYQGSHPAGFIEQVIATESDGVPKAVSRAGRNSGLGLMQISKVALQDYNNWNGTKYTQDDLMDPETNIKIGSWFLGKTGERIKSQDPREIYAAYNVGTGNWSKEGYKDKWLAGINPLDGSKYGALKRFDSFAPKKPTAVPLAPDSIPSRGAANVPVTIKAPSIVPLPQAAPVMPPSAPSVTETIEAPLAKDLPHRPEDYGKKYIKKTDPATGVKYWELINAVVKKNRFL